MLRRAVSGGDAGCSRAAGPGSLPGPVAGAATGAWKIESGAQSIWVRPVRHHRPDRKGHRSSGVAYPRLRCWEPDPRAGSRAADFFRAKIGIWKSNQEMGRRARARSIRSHRDKTQVRILELGRVATRGSRTENHMADSTLVEPMHPTVAQDTSARKSRSVRDQDLKS